MYPVLREDVTLGTFTCDGSEEIRYYAENAKGEQFEISHRLLEALLEADGTRPLNLPNHGRRLIPKLVKLGLVRNSRFVVGRGLWNRFILFPISSRVEKAKPVFQAINAALPPAAFLFLALGIFFMVNNEETYGYGDQFYSLTLTVALFLLSVILHEFGHFAAALSYGFPVTDVGIILLVILPMGAYVACYDKKDAKKRERIQFDLAGLEMNLLIAGVCFIIAAQVDTWFLQMIFVAILNLVMVCLNLLPTAGMDGENAMSALFEVRNISEVADMWLIDRERRQELLHSGAKGYACIGVLALTLIARVIFWGLMAYNAYSILAEIF